MIERDHPLRGRAVRSHLRLVEDDGDHRPALRGAEPGTVHRLVEAASHAVAELQPGAVRFELLMALEQTCAQVLHPSNGVPASSEPGRLPRADPLTGLSERELVVLHRLNGGETNTQIAAALWISTNTMKTHVRHIYGKLGASNRASALARARELGIV